MIRFVLMTLFCSYSLHGMKLPKALITLAKVKKKQTKSLRGNEFSLRRNLYLELENDHQYPLIKMLSFFYAIPKHGRSALASELVGTEGTNIAAALFINGNENTDKDYSVNKGRQEDIFENMKKRPYCFRVLAPIRIAFLDYNNAKNHLYSAIGNDRLNLDHVQLSPDEMSLLTIEQNGASDLLSLYNISDIGNPVKIYSTNIWTKHNFYKLTVINSDWFKDQKIVLNRSKKNSSSIVEISLSNIEFINKKAGLGQLLFLMYLINFKGEHKKPLHITYPGLLIVNNSFPKSIRDLLAQRKLIKIG